MLVLSRNRNESIVIGDDIKLTVTDIRTDESTNDSASVRIGIQAPKEVSIYRQEVFDRMHAPKSGRPSKPKPKRNIPGKRHPIRNAVIQLRIEAPPGTPIQCSRAAGSADSPQPLDLSFGAGSDSIDAPKDVTSECRPNDHILIGNQMMLTIVDVGRFVFDRGLCRAEGDAFPRS